MLIRGKKGKTKLILAVFLPERCKNDCCKRWPPSFRKDVHKLGRIDRTSVENANKIKFTNLAKTPWGCNNGNRGC